MGELAAKLCELRCLSVDEYARLISEHTEGDAKGLAEFAFKECERVYGDAVFSRGLTSSRIIVPMIACTAVSAGEMRNAIVIA